MMQEYSDQATESDLNCKPVPKQMLVNADSASRMELAVDSPPAADGVAAVDRAIAIVAAVARHPRPVTLAELSAATGLYKSTVLRLLASLERAALVQRLPNGRYGLGPFSHQLGQAYEKSYRLADIVLPVLNSLVEQGTESASFHVYRDERWRQCVLRVDSNHPTLDRIRVGDLLPMSKGAAGRLLTAYLVDRKAAAESGVIFLSIGERDPSCAAVSSPVFGPDHLVIGAVSLSGPKERFTPVSIKRMSRQAILAAKSATQALGGDWPAVNTTPPA